MNRKLPATRNSAAPLLPAPRTPSKTWWPHRSPSRVPGREAAVPRLTTQGGGTLAIPPWIPRAVPMFPTAQYLVRLQLRPVAYERHVPLLATAAPKPRRQPSADAVSQLLTLAAPVRDEAALGSRRSLRAATLALSPPLVSAHLQSIHFPGPASPQAPPPEASSRPLHAALVENSQSDSASRLLPPAGIRFGTPRNGRDHVGGGVTPPRPSGRCQSVLTSHALLSACGAGHPKDRG